MIISALLLIRQGKMLFIHTRNSKYLTYPGGVKKSNETELQALHRGAKHILDVDLRDVYQFGKVQGRGEKGEKLELHLFRGEFAREAHPRSSADRLLWLTRWEAECSTMLPDITRQQVLPLLAMCAIW